MRQWFVVRTKTGQEDRAVWHLHNQGFEVYLPKYRKVVRHARRTKTVLRPLFPGYIFVKMDTKTQRWRSINGTVGVLELVQFGSYPHSIDEALVNAIQSREDEDGVIVILTQGLEKGDVIRIGEGPLAEHTALIEEVCDERRVILLLDLMGREVRVHAPTEKLTRVYNVG